MLPTEPLPQDPGGVSSTTPGPRERPTQTGKARMRGAAPKTDPRAKPANAVAVIRPGQGPRSAQMECHMCATRVCNPLNLCRSTGARLVGGGGGFLRGTRWRGASGQREVFVLLFLPGPPVPAPLSLPDRPGPMPGPQRTGPRRTNAERFTRRKNGPPGNTPMADRRGQPARTGPSGRTSLMRGGGYGWTVVGELDAGREYGPPAPNRIACPRHHPPGERD